MRIQALRVANIAALAHGEIALPATEVLAIAGPNGSGKSRLLLALIAPWLQELPASADPESEASAAVTLMLTETERDELGRLGQEFGWNDPVPPKEVTITVRRRPRAGIQLVSEPRSLALQNALGNITFLERVPSLDVVYLPPERRLTSKSQEAIDLRALSPAVSLESTRNARAMALQNAGRLDESEFQNYARALCVAAYLPAGDQTPGAGVEDARQAWQSFEGAVNQLLEPKKLLPLTRTRPGDLLVQLPTRANHAIDALSSGERQALVILSRLFRAGRSRMVTIIDEPDLHLHPQLSAQLFASIRLLEPSQLILATHSPFILDSVPTDAIIELRHASRPRFLQSEQERVGVYRHAGFRASELTQSDLLVVTEGGSDAALLAAMEPSLARAAVRPAGGRSRVLQLASELANFADLPVLGIIDSDVLGDPIPDHVRSHVVAWPYTDIEAVFLADDSVLAAMIAANHIQDEYALVATLRREIDELIASQHENAVAEVTQRLLQQRFPDPYPTPRGDLPVERLRDAFLADRRRQISEGDFNAIVSEARQRVDSATHPLVCVRGKEILNKFAAQTSHFREGGALLLAVARVLSRPPETAIPILNAIRLRLNLPAL